MNGQLLSEKEEFLTRQLITYIGSKRTLLDFRDVITFQGTTVKEIEKAFKDSINDYIAWCKEDV